jgi:hypothetical protein
MFTKASSLSSSLFSGPLLPFLLLPLGYLLPLLHFHLLLILSCLYFPSCVIRINVLG